MKKQVIILYVMDALRADRLGCFGYNKPTSEHIDNLAESGVVFENIYSQSTETKSSASTIFTSTYLSVHNTSAHTDILPDGLPTLAECLKKNGFATAAFNTNIRLGVEYGFARGVDHHVDLHAKEQFDNINSLPSSKDINRELLNWLKQVETDKIFITAWSMDTHLPWYPPEEIAAKFVDNVDQSPPGTMESIINAKKDSDFKYLENLYDAEIAHNDRNIGELIQQLKKMNLWDDTTFVLTADHGEMFREHGHFMFHGGSPYRETIHVPLIIKSPGLPAGRSQNFGGLIDVMPTILAMAETAAPDTAQGVNIFQDNQRSYVFSESQQANFKNAAAVLDANWKLIRNDFISNPIKKKLFNNKKIQADAGEAQAPSPEMEDLHNGISKIMLKKARIQVLKYEYIGVPPKFDINFLSWLSQMWKHFFSDIRLELYDRRNDPLETENVVLKNPQLANDLFAKLDEFIRMNNELRDRLQLHKQHKSLDAEVVDRLRQLGYL